MTLCYLHWVRVGTRPEAWYESLVATAAAVSARPLAGRRLLPSADARRRILMLPVVLGALWGLWEGYRTL